jgi:hypothetical protein
MTPHDQAITAAQAAINRLGDLFGLFGDAETGDGLYEIYVSLINDLRTLETLQQIRARLARFDRDVYALVGEWIDIAIDIGEEQGKKNTDIFGLEPVLHVALQMPIIQLAKDAIQAAFAAQSFAVLALLAGNTTVDELGALLTPGAILREIARQLVLVANTATETMLTEALNRSGASSADWRKQLVSTIDTVTTRTCLNAHGQVQPIGKPFVLCCTPWESAKNYGFSAWVPPFHWWCRTVIVYIPAALADSETTKRMKADAARVIAEQAGKGKGA